MHGSITLKIDARLCILCFLGSRNISSNISVVQLVWSSSSRTQSSVSLVEQVCAPKFKHKNQSQFLVLIPSRACLPSHGRVRTGYLVPGTRNFVFTKSVHIKHYGLILRATFSWWLAVISYEIGNLWNGSPESRDVPFQQKKRSLPGMHRLSFA